MKPAKLSTLRVEQLEDRLAPSADMVIQWNETLRETVRTAGTPGPAIGRIMAITQAAVYDSVNALDRTHEVYLVDALAHPKASREAAVAAAATVLADFFGTDNVSFTLPSQNPAIPARSYTSFSQAAEESAVSRLYGGIHWNFDNNVGLTAGTAVGEYVVANFLRPVAREAVAGVVNGELIVVGTEDGDFLHVVRAGNALVVWANGERLGQFAAGVTAIVVDARGGNDLILLAPQIKTDAEIYGGAGNDLIMGGAGDDRIFGEEGHDMILGNSGNDHLDGGSGDDFLFGGSGRDELFGGPGDDWLFGGPGVDALDGGPGRNRSFQ